jgi:hypothetical protein
VRGGYSASDVSNEPVFPNSCADVNASDSITAPDALAILRKSVGQDIDLTCILRSATLATGQTDCYSEAGVVIPCAGTGQDAEFQRGIARTFTNNGDGTVTDGQTGLVWEILSGDASVHSGGDEYNSTGAVQVKIAQLNNSAFAGHSDWRLPNFFEVESLLNFGDSLSAVYDAYFNNSCEAGCTNTECSCLPESGSLWSSTTAINGKTLAYTTNLDSGEFEWVLKSSATVGVRGVRGGD